MNQSRIYRQIHEYHPDNAKPILKLLLEKTIGEKPAGYTGYVEQKNNDKRRVVGKKHDRARTAYQRLLVAGDINGKAKKQVKKIYHSLNFIKLRKKSEKLKCQLFQTVID